MAEMAIDRGKDWDMLKMMAAVGSLVFFVVAPGLVAGLIPWWLTGWQLRDPLPYWLPLRIAGAALLAAGLAVLVQAFARFVMEGLGTPAPIAPTRQLVIGGLYRHVRNPMYVAVIAIIVGQVLILGQPWLLAYAAAVWLACAAFVRWYEEPALARRFGVCYAAYRRGVPAWWPRARPWAPAGQSAGLRRD